MHLDELNLRFGRIDQRLLELESEFSRIKRKRPFWAAF
jgi:hypothetical protein